MADRHPFDADTAVEPRGDGRYAATVTGRWSLPAGHANGGYALAICLSALRAESPYPDPVATTGHYLRRVEPGPAELVVETIRQGRRIWVGEVRLVQNGAERVRVIANFADIAAAEGRTELRNSAPDLPPPGECVELSSRTAPPALTLAERLEFRYPKLPGWRSGEPRGELEEEFWMRFAPDESGRVREPDTLAAAVLVDMAAPPVMDIGEYTSTTIELTVHVRGVPAPGWLACRASTRHLVDGYHDEDFEIWDSQGRLVAQSRQLLLLP